MSTVPTIDRSYKAAPDNPNLGGIPGDLGVPYFGNAIEIVSKYIDTLYDRTGKYGPISRLKMVSQTGAMIVGPDLFQHIFQDRDQNFSAEMGYIAQLGRFYRGALLLMDFDEHKAQRRMMQSAFRTSALHRYMEMMYPLIQAHIARWGQEKEFVFYDHIKHLLLEIGAKCFLGLDNVGKDMKYVNELFLTVNEGLVTLVRWDVPFTTFGKAKRARDELEAYFKKLIADRRAQGPGGEDMLSQMCHERNEAGELYPVEEVMMHGIFLLFAAHDTSASTLTNMASHFGRDKKLQGDVRTELRTLAPGRLTPDELDKTPFLDRVVQETMRLTPPVAMMMRRNLREFTWEGVTIPPNTILYMPSIINHRDPKYWTNPDQFDPDRFLPERAEHRKHPMCYHPFGSGIHKCIGYHFAELMIKSVIKEYVLTWDSTATPAHSDKMEWFPLPKPKDGVPLVLKPAT